MIKNKKMIIERLQEIIERINNNHSKYKQPNLVEEMDEYGMTSMCNYLIYDIKSPILKDSERTKTIDKHGDTFFENFTEWKYEQFNSMIEHDINKYFILIKDHFISGRSNGWLGIDTYLYCGEGIYIDPIDLFNFYIELKHGESTTLDFIGEFFYGDYKSDDILMYLDEIDKHLEYIEDFHKTFKSYFWADFDVFIRNGIRL